MFGKKSFIVKMVDDKVVDGEPVVVNNTTDYKELAEIVLGGTVVILGVYFLGDTLRQVSIYTAMARIPHRVA